VERRQGAELFTKTVGRTMAGGDHRARKGDRAEREQ
jgi:hypothetical protein